LKIFFFLKTKEYFIDLTDLVSSYSTGQVVIQWDGKSYHYSVI